MVLELEKRRDIAQWFRGLSRAKRRLLRTVRARDEVIVARYVEPGDAADDEDGGANLYEYLVNHEISEITRVFRICTAEPEARAALARRHLPVDFACPRASASCPMRALLAACPRHDVRFFARGDR